MRDDSNFVKLKCLIKEKEVFHNKDYLCLFGNSGNVFRIANNCNKNKNSFSNLGYYNEYDLRYSIQSNTLQARQYLSGSFRFKVLEIEIF